MPEFTEVLTEAVADVTDGAHAEADQVAVGMRGVAHKVALQRAGSCDFTSSSSGSAKWSMPM